MICRSVHSGVARETQARPLGSAKCISRRPGRLSVRANAAGESTKPNLSQLAAAAAGPVTDEAVPEGHQGLHSFLYSSGDAEHASQRYEFRQGEDDGSNILPVEGYLESRDGERPLGVYALYDEKHNLQYVGYARNIVLAVKGHLVRVGESRCAFIRPMVFANKAMATRSHMERQVQDWIEQAAVVPPGNGVEAHLWGEGSGGEGDSSSSSEAELMSKMSPTERAAYETKKLKLRKAMGESLHDDVDVDQTAAERRLALLAAVSGDNWSSVVSEQTQATLTAAVAAGGGRLGGRQLPPDVAAPHPHHVAGRQPTTAGSGSSSSSAAAASAGSGVAVGAVGAGGGDGDSGPVVSPFTMASVHRQVGESHKAAAAAAQAGQPPLTFASVSAALEDVRPYLLADGGDVTVLDVNVGTGVVMVELQGACSSCASSSATLKMGIERQLKAVFGDAVSEVVQVNTGGGRPAASVEAIDMHLNMLRSAVANLGGSVDVASVGGGVCVLNYSGPPAIGKGLSAAIKDAFPDVREVVLRDAPPSSS